MGGHIPAPLYIVLHKDTKYQVTFMLLTSEFTYLIIISYTETVKDLKKNTIFLKGIYLMSILVQDCNGHGQILLVPVILTLYKYHLKINNDNLVSNETYKK